MSSSENSQQESRRLAAVCKAWWDATPAGSPDMGKLHDCLVDADISESPTEAQQKILLLMLPASVIGQGIAWGFSDSAVGDSIREFIEENRDSVSRAMLLQGGQAPAKPGKRSATARMS